MDIQRIPISSLTPAPDNPCLDLRPGDADSEKLSASIGRWGCVEPLVWNRRTGHLVGGHQRFKVLTARGEAELDVSMAHHDRETRHRWSHPDLLKGTLRTHEGFAMSPSTVQRPGSKKDPDGPKRRVRDYVSQKALRHGYKSCTIKNINAEHLVASLEQGRSRTAFIHADREVTIYAKSSKSPFISRGVHGDSPPAMVSAVPETNPACGEASHTAAAAISRTLATRPRGVTAATAAGRFGLPSRACMSVAVVPTRIATTRMPSGPSSLAAPTVRVSTAAFEAA